MRSFRALDGEEKDAYVVIFADGVAGSTALPDTETGVAVLFDAEMADDDATTAFGETYPIVVYVHESISHISLTEARALRDALTGIVDG
jgi:hypothetical protein